MRKAREKRDFWWSSLYQFQSYCVRYSLVSSKMTACDVLVNSLSVHTNTPETEAYVQESIRACCILHM